MFTKLTDEEKLDCLIYMGKFLSNDEGIAAVQCEMIERVLDIIIKECDYSFNGVEKDRNIFYLDWLNNDLTPEYCESKIGYIVERTEVYKKLYTAMKEDYHMKYDIDTDLRSIKFDYLLNFQYYLCDSWYDFEVDEMIEFFNNYHRMYAQRYFRKEGLIYTGHECEYDSCKDIPYRIKWRPRKNISLINPVEHYQNGLNKIIKEEGYLKEELDREKRKDINSMRYIEASMEYDVFMFFKFTLLNGIEELEKNNYKFEENPFKELDYDFKNRFTVDFKMYFESMDMPEIARLL